jgi:hypothetical protein
MMKMRFYLGEMGRTVEIASDVFHLHMWIKMLSSHFILQTRLSLQFIGAPHQLTMNETQTSRPDGQDHLTGGKIAPPKVMG